MAQHRSNTNPCAEPSKRRRLGRSEVEHLFSLPLPAAAVELGVSTSKLKKECRNLGIARWPFSRRRAPLDNLRDSSPPPNIGPIVFAEAPRQVTLEGGGDADGAAKAFDAWWHL